MNEKAIVASVNNAMRILREFSIENREFGVSELSLRLGISKSTVYRSLLTMQANGLIQKNEETQKYHLGVGVFELGFVYYHTIELRRTAVPWLKKLMLAMHKPVRLGVYYQSNIIDFYSEAPNEHAFVRTQVGYKTPVHCTAIGKLLLAYQSEDEIERVISVKLKDYTPNTITSKDKIIEELQIIRQQGYAVSNAEFIHQYCAISVPVYNYREEVIAGFCIICPKENFLPSQTTQYVKEMRRYSKLITEHLETEYV